MGKQNFHENTKKVFEPVTDTNKKTSEDLIKTMMLTSKENSKALQILNVKVLEIMNVRGMKASYLLSLLSKITNPEHTSQYKLVKDPNSERVIDLLINKTVPIILYNIFLHFVIPIKGLKWIENFLKW